MSLETLANPLERITYLREGVNVRTAPTTPPTQEWNATLQYFYGDIAISGVDGYAYCYTGASTGRTCILDGGDPATNADWIKFVGAGVSTYDINTATATGAANVYTFTAGGTFTAPAGSDWLVTLQGSATAAAAVDISTFTLTGNGVGGTSQALSVTGAGAFGQSAAISVGTSGTSIVLTGAFTGANITGFTGKISFVRLG